VKHPTGHGARSDWFRSEWFRVVVTVALTIALCSTPSTAQEGEQASEREGAQEGEQAGADTASVQDYGSSLIPLPVIFYQPETGTGFGATVNYLFYISPPREGEPTPASNKALRPSLLSATGIYTTKKQVITWLGGEVYPAAGRYWLTGGLGYSKFVTKYWGVGNDTPAAAEEDYTPDLVGGTMDILREVASHLYAGVSVDAGYRRLLEVAEDGLLASGMQPGAANGSLIGLGLLLTWDSRDSNTWPRRGSLHQGRAKLNSGFFGSDYDYASFSIDVRKYVPVFASHALALRALGQASAGTPPFDRMPQLGGEMLQRGYFQGRYRDRQLLAFQAEYRLPVVWRIGAVAFASAGQVGDVWGNIGMDRFHTALGGGIRFLVVPDEGVNIRADFAYGFSVESGSFYLSFGEAF
jgi:hypothetical protein